MSPAQEAADLLRQLGVDASDGDLESFSPIDGKPIGRVRTGDPAAAAANAAEAFQR